MKVIFLDIDGVLSSVDDMSQGVHISTEKVKLLRRIVKETGAKVCITSTWRHGVSLESFSYWLWKMGLPADAVVGKTADNRGYTRGHEIEDWIRAWHADHEKDEWISVYVILDDDADFFGYQKKHFLVQTRSHYGLTVMHVDAAIKCLKGEKFEPPA